MKRFFWLPIFVVFAQLLQAQTNNGLDRPYRYYATQEVMQRIWKENPKLKANILQIESANSDFKIKGSAKKVVIPVVFHLLYTPGKDEYVEAEVYAQLDALNRDFNSIDLPQEEHPSFRREQFIEKVAQTEIEFCLAEIKKGEPGIIWTPSGQAVWSSDDAMKLAKGGGSAPQNTKECLNVWVCHLTTGISGYAQMPGGPESTDGIVIDFSYFGLNKYAKAPYHQGKTLTHLVGSYLGLYELWNDYQACADDEVHDTPIHNAPNYGNPGYPHISMCPDQLVEMTMNFMDNTDDAAQYMFTLGQKLRMQSVFAKGAPREGLTKSKFTCYKRPQNLLGTSSNSDLSSPNANEAKLSVSLFPNPANQSFKLSVSNPDIGKLLVSVYNAKGQLMQQSINEIGAGQHQFDYDSSKWSAGIYLVHTVINNQTNIQRLVIIKP